MGIEPAAFIDLGRSVRAFDGLAEVASHELKPGVFNNVPRALKNERWVVNSVLEAARSNPAAFTGATDVTRGTELLQHAVDAADSALGALGAIPRAETYDISAIEGPLRGAAQDIREAHALLGGTRDLPAFEPLAPGQVLDAPEVFPPSHELLDAPHASRLQSIGRRILRFGGRQAMGLRTFGRENVPAAGRVIVTPTHGSLRDPVDVLGSVDRTVTAMANKNVIKGPVGKVMRAAGTFPVTHGDAATGMAAARGALAQDKALEMFDEAMIVHGDYLGAPRDGVATLALQMDAPVVPMASYGNKPGLFRGEEGFRRPLVTTVVGHAIDAQGAPATPTNIALMRERIARTQDGLMDIARGNYASRRSSWETRRMLYGLGGLGAAGAGTAYLASRD